MLRSRKFSLLMALVFIFTMVFPFAAFASEDNTSIRGAYTYVKADDEAFAGVVSVVYDDWEADTEDVVIQMTLPEGVDFTDEPDGMAWTTDTAGTKVDSSSDYFEARFDGVDANFDVDFNFGYDNNDNDEYDDGDVALDINDDFSGNLNVAVEVIGLNSDGDIIWTDNDDVTIAKVSGGDVTITVGDTKKVSVGNDAEVADITLEESKGRAFSVNEIITLEIETDGVEFASVDVESTRLGLEVGNAIDDSGAVDHVNGTTEAVADGTTETITNFAQNNDDEDTIMYIEITTQSQNLPGSIKFDEILLDVAPDVSGEIEISVSSNLDADLDETVVVADVDDCDLTVTVDEETGMEEHMRKTSIGELWEITIETNGEFEEGDKVYITLPDNFEFYKKALGFFQSLGKISDRVDYMGTFDDNQSVWLEIKAEGDGKDEITLSNLFIGSLPDAEYGDINVEISGDIGQATVKAGFHKPGLIPKPEPTYVVRGHNQLAGNITATETDKDGIKNDIKFFMTLPNGVEFASKPTVTVNGEEIDGVKIGPGSYDKDVCQITIDKFKSSQIDILEVSNIRYDIEDWFMPGEVIKVKIGGNDPLAEDNFNQFYESLMVGFRDFVINGIDSWDDFQFKSHADGTIVEVPNAIIGDPDQVTASFNLEDDGVYVEGGRTLVQVNLLTEVLGLQKSWDEATKIAYFVKNGKVVAFPINQNKIFVNKAEIQVDQGGKIINNYTCVTLRGLEMAFGGKLSWDNETKTATFVFKK